MTEENIKVRVGGVPPINERTANGRDLDDGIEIRRFIVKPSSDNNRRVEKINRRLQGSRLVTNSSSR